MRLSSKNKERLDKIKTFGVKVGKKVTADVKTYMSDDVRRGRMEQLMSVEKRKIMTEKEEW